MDGGRGRGKTTHTSKQASEAKQGACKPSQAPIRSTDTHPQEGQKEELRVANMGWGTEGEPVRRQSLDDPVLASLANAEERRVKRWDPLREKEPEPKPIDADQAKKLHERFLKVQAAAVAAAQEDLNNQGHPSLSELRRRKAERAEKERGLVLSPPFGKGVG